MPHTLQFVGTLVISVLLMIGIFVRGNSIHGTPVDKEVVSYFQMFFNWIYVTGFLLFVVGYCLETKIDAPASIRPAKSKL
jgi:hypothetical protein